MARGHKFSDPLDQQIYDAHRRYIEVMEDIRMGAISTETKEKYLQIITALTEKLALPKQAAFGDHRRDDGGSRALPLPDDAESLSWSSTTESI